MDSGGCVVTDAGVLEMVEIDVSLDFDPPCDWESSQTGAGCDLAAVWIGVFSCCGVEILRCHRHRRTLEAAMDGHAAKGCRSIHVTCMHHVERVRWEPVRGGGGD